MDRMQRKATNLTSKYFNLYDCSSCHTYSVANGVPSLQLVMSQFAACRARLSNSALQPEVVDNEGVAWQRGCELSVG
jgi:hypothetical protein